MKSLALVATLVITASATSIALPFARLGAQDNDRRSKNWHGTAGIGAGSLGSFYGSDASRALGFPFIDITYRNRIRFRTSASGGIGGGVEAMVHRGPVVGTLGIAGIEARPEDRADGLAGMDDRSGGTFGTVGLAVRAGPVSATTNTAIGLGRRTGVTETLGLQLAGQIAPRLTASVGGTGAFANRTNMMFDFGITEGQAARRRSLIAAGDGRLRESDTTAFAPKAGLKEARGTLQLAYEVRGPWRAIGLVSTARLTRDVSDSPLARSRSATSVAAGFAYKW